MRKQDSDDQTRRAKSILKRIEQESEKILGAGTTGSDDDQNDAIDLWGKRIGRGIGYVIVLFLLWHLSTTYFFR